MNLPMTSREDMITVCRELVQEKDLSAINMRCVAEKCHISVGAVYNYFPSKTELVCATIESIWKEIFHMEKESFAFTDFITCLSWLFERIKQGSITYPQFLSRHAIMIASEDKMQGQQMMKKYFVHLQEKLQAVLKRDKKIRASAFSGDLSEEAFINYMLELFMYFITSGADNYDGILELARRYLY